MPRAGQRTPAPGVRLAAVLIGAPVVAVVAMALLGLWSVDRAAGGATAQLAQPATGNTAVVQRRTVLRARPNARSRPLATIGRRTDFRSPRVMPVLERRGDWLRVMDAALDNGQTGWVQAADTKPGNSDYAIRVELSERRIDVLRGGRVVRRVRTAIGQNRSPTPTGQFAVTDKVPFTDPASPYGCCALALTAHQENLPANWRGGDRIAIHATPARESIGLSITLGCMRVPTDDARWLMERVPLGTRVSIRA